MKKAMSGMTIGIIAAVVIAAFVIGYYLASSGAPAVPSTNTGSNASSGASSGVGTDGTAFQRENLNEVLIQNNNFSPAEIRIKAGSKVTWTNMDSTTHSVVSDSGSEGGISSGLLAKGQAYAKVFEQPGTYNYHCGLHSTMRGKVIVE